MLAQKKFSFILCCTFSCNVLGMKKEEIIKTAPLFLHEKRITNYIKEFFEQKTDGPLRQNPNSYEEQIKQQCIQGGMHTANLFALKPENVYSKNEKPNDYIKKICSVITFLFTEFQSNRAQGPNWWTLKLKDAELWSHFFIHHLNKLSIHSATEHIRKLNVQDIEESSMGYLIMINDDTHPFILPHGDNEILVIPNQEKDYITIKTGKEAETGWAFRDVKGSFMQKMYSFVQQPKIMINGVASWLKKTSLFGKFLLKDDPRQTEYLSEDLVEEIKKVFPKMEISSTSPTVFALYSRVDEALMCQNSMEIINKLEKLQGYLRRKFKNITIRRGNEIIMSKEWLRVNALFYGLLRNSKNSNDTDSYHHDEVSQNYYDVLKEFRKLNDLIFAHNHNPELYAYTDDIYNQALVITSDEFKKNVAKHVPDEKVKQHLSSIITTLECALQSSERDKNLLELPFFDEDNLTSIQKGFLDESKDKKKIELVNLNTMGQKFFSAQLNKKNTPPIFNIKEALEDIDENWANTDFTKSPKNPTPINGYSPIEHTVIQEELVEKSNEDPIPNESQLVPQNQLEQE